MVDLKTTYLGLKLKNPIIVGASNLMLDLKNIKKMEKAGAAAIVYKSLFEEQIELEKLQLDEMIEEYCKEQNIPILMHIPLDINIARAYSKGIGLVEAMPEWRESFIKLYNEITGLTAERQAA